jgi:hypothetical protein
MVVVVTATNVVVVVTATIVVVVVAATIVVVDVINRVVEVEVVDGLFVISEVTSGNSLVVVEVIVVEVVVVGIVVVGVVVVGVVVVEDVVAVSDELESVTPKPIARPIIVKAMTVNETKNMILNFLVSLDFLTSLSSSDSISNVSWGLILLVLIFLPNI